MTPDRAPPPGGTGGGQDDQRRGGSIAPQASRSLAIPDHDGPLTNGTRVDHPTRFSPEIIDVLRLVLGDLATTCARVHDPYAGTGQRLGTLADELGLIFTGSEIEASFIVDARVSHGDATDPATYPTEPYIIVTSPVYPNGMADHWQAKDQSRRRTYRASVALNEGTDRPLHARNMGRYGYRGSRPGSPKRQAYWRLAAETVACWQGATTAIVNVSDFISAGVVEPVVEPWRDLLVMHGFVEIDTHDIRTRRARDGANHDRRVEAEAVMVATRRGWSP